VRKSTKENQAKESIMSYIIPSIQADIDEILLRKKHGDIDHALDYIFDVVDERFSSNNKVAIMMNDKFLEHFPLEQMGPELSYGLYSISSHGGVLLKNFKDYTKRMYEAYPELEELK